MTAFDPSTSYETDYQLADQKEFADWLPDNQSFTDLSPLWRVSIEAIIVKRGNITTSDFATLAATVALSPATAAFLVANPTDQDFNPSVNDILAMDDGVRMMITGLEKPELGCWYRMLVEPETVDA